MHKSIIVLLGLLTFLIPVGPSISNSNAMALEEYGYGEADQYEKYANNMANENYYKSQGSDFIKKIKCNNINSNLNGIEANIGTGDSLGLGAESLEADDASADWLNNGEKNNGDFDLDCINTNNNQGGQGQVGPQGPQGPAGPAGPAGITQLINGTNLYLVERSAGAGLGPATLECEPGDFALNGGYRLLVTTDDERNNSLVTEDKSITDALDGTPGNGWIVEVEVPEDDSFDYQVYAWCFDNPPLNTLATTDSVSAFQQPEDSPIVSQATEDSPDLTATEKITKLKTQWLDLLP